MAVHVTPHEKGWQVKTGGSKKAYKVTDTQMEAMTVARKVAINQKTDVKVHGKDGKIRDGNNYSNHKK